MTKTNMMKNRKAQSLLPEETLKIILAIIGIGLLILLAVLLYGIFAKKNAVVQAEANMDYIKNIIDRIDAEIGAGTGKKSEEYVLLNPKGWGLSAWPVSIDGKDKSPNACLGWKRCICFCEVNWFSNMPFQNPWNSHLKSCNQLNVCRKIEQDTLLLEPNPIEVNELLKKGRAKKLEITIEKQENKETKLTIKAV